MAIQHNNDKMYPSNQIIITTQDDLTRIVDNLAEEMYDKKIFLSTRDANRLSGVDPDVTLISLNPNQMLGIGTSTGSGPDNNHSGKFYKNGTRTYYEYSNNGTLLKSIIIHDVPEKNIEIIIK